MNFFELCLFSISKDFGVNLIITNAYIIKNSKKHEVIEKQGLQPTPQSRRNMTRKTQ